MSSFEFEFEAIGTHWKITINQPVLKLSLDEVKKRIFDRIEIFDKNYSRFRRDSLVTQMSLKAGNYTMPDDFKKMIDAYHYFFKATDGAMTPLIGSVLVDAGYDAQYSLKQKKALTKPLSWQEALNYNHPILTIKKAVLLDFGAAGKGYLVDIIGELLEANDVKNYCIDAGGDLRHRSDDDQKTNHKKIKVGLENPSDTKQVIGLIEISNISTAASAGNRRVWQDFHHIINANSLTSPRHIVAVWVVSSTTLIADALATALFFKPASAFSEYSFEYLILFKDFSIEKSKHFDAELYYN